MKFVTNSLKYTSFTVAVAVLKVIEVFGLSCGGFLWNFFQDPGVGYAYAEAHEVLFSCHGQMHCKAFGPICCLDNDTAKSVGNSNNPRCSHSHRLLVLVGKGPTARRVARGTFPHSILVGLNEGVNLVEDPDYLVCDFRNGLVNYRTGESNLLPDVVRKIKNIVVPKYHLGMRYTAFLKFLQGQGFEGHVHLYNHPKTPEGMLDKNLPTLTGYRSSGEVALKYLLLHDKNKLNISGVITFGISSGPVNHPYSISFPAKAKSYKTYMDNDRLTRVYENIMSILKGASVRYKLC